MNLLFELLLSWLVGYYAAREWRVRNYHKAALLVTTLLVYVMLVIDHWGCHR